jgi:SAM-dependent methyltransferase
MVNLNVLYDEEFYREQLYEGLYFEQQKVGGLLAWMFKPTTKSFLDVGCGFGGMTDELLQHYEKKLCIDGSLTVVKFMLPKVMEYFKCLDIINPDYDVGKFDLVFSFEVAEHLEEKYADTFINFLINHCNKYLVLSAALPGSKGKNHVNCKPRDYWVKKLQDAQFELDETKIIKWRNIAKKQFARSYYQNPIICKPIKTDAKI